MQSNSQTNNDSVRQLMTPTEVETLLQLFEQVASEENWLLGTQLRGYPITSRYIAAQVNNQVVGGFQVVLPDASGHLPCLVVWPEALVDASGHTAHVTVLAMRREYRGRLRLFWSLCAEFWRFCVAENIDTIVVETTPAMLVRYRRLGWPLEVIGDLRLHWGEECYLCRLDVRSVAGSMLMRSLRSSIYRALVDKATLPVTSSTCPFVPALP